MGFHISGNPSSEEVAAIVAALTVVSARKSATPTSIKVSNWGRPILRTPLSGAWGAPEFR